MNVITETTEHWSNGQLRKYCFLKGGLLHGECKWWHDNGQIDKQCFFKGGQRHGESKWWWPTGTPAYHEFYKEDTDITDSIKLICDNILCISKEERMLIKLQFGIECLT